MVLPPWATIVPMSLQPAIPSWVALQQSPRPLRRPPPASRNILLRQDVHHTFCSWRYLQRQILRLRPVHGTRTKLVSTKLGNSN